MCGLVGFWRSPAEVRYDLLLKDMAATLVHRGPDDGGFWYDSKFGIGLGHRRLAILDLTSAGHQPMLSYDKRYTIVYNGEIYNHLDIRKMVASDFKFFKWKGSSDTETLLVAIQYYGLEKTLSLLNGMFAFALWDSLREKLFLVRDRMGEKPLYYGKVGEYFVFASELKAFKVLPEWYGKVDHRSLSQYVKSGYISAPYTIYEDIKKLQPGYFAVIKNFDDRAHDLKSYWSLADTALSGLDSINKSSNFFDHKNNLHSLIKSSVKSRMLSDVPVGAFLSGGYDSTMVAALMQLETDSPVKTFSIGFHEDDYNEAMHASRIAKFLDTDHVEYYVSAKKAIDVIPKLTHVYDEPFADVSQIPTMLLSAIARKDVPVILSGDGGDELFAGYNRHIYASIIWSKLSKLPISIRVQISAILDLVERSKTNNIINKCLGVSKIPQLNNKLWKLSSALNATDFNHFYTLLTSSNFSDSILIDDNFSLNESNILLEEFCNTNKMLYYDQRTYLPDDILTKVDRASMASSLEVRVPLLDHRLVEYSWKLPLEQKIVNKSGKWLFRQILYDYVPKNLLDRPKQGFSVPIGVWLRGSLREWGENLINSKKLKDDGYFDTSKVNQLWTFLLDGKDEYQQIVWNILIFQAWLSEK